jgi:aspartyl-tRNA(Asn)/glutamyl-tRNA(Gln) amidotransferase subunit A
MASSFDCIGPITRSAEDAAIVLQIIAGVDSMDATTIELSNKDQVASSKSALKIGIAKEYADHPNIVEAKNQLSEHELIEIDLPDGELALAAYYVLVPSEISSNLERYDSLRFGSVAGGAQDLLDRYAKSRGVYFGKEVKRRNLIGTYALSAGYYDAYYNKAMQIRTLVRQAYDAIFEQCDVVIMPTTVAPAFKLGAKSDPVEMYKTDILTVSANLAGVPAISIPASFDAGSGLPYGLQIMSAQKNDNLVLQLATQFQTATDWHTRRPSL